MSAVQEREATGLYSPAPLTTRTSKRCAPSVSPSTVNGVEHAANGAPSSEHSEPTTPSDDAHDQVTVGRRSLARGLDLPLHARVEPVALPRGPAPGDRHVVRPDGQPVQHQRAGAWAHRLV